MQNNVYKWEGAIKEFRSLEWFQIHRGSEEAGELLAAFEMFEVIHWINSLNYWKLELHRLFWREK